MGIKKFNVIGIHQSGLISSAALVSNGKVVFASAEERFSRIKQDDSFPEKTIKYILKKFKLDLKDINFFSIGWNPGENLSIKYRKNFSSTFRYPGDIITSVSNQILGNLSKTKINNSQIVFQNKSFKKEHDVKIDFVDHHTSHLRLGIHSSGFEECAVLVVDGWSEQKTTSLHTYKNKKTKLLKEFKFPNSIGCFYSSLTQFLGYRPLKDEWKIMGMSAYGNYKKINSDFYKLIKLYENGNYELNLKYFDFYNFDRREWFTKELENILGKPRKENEKITQRHYDIAAATQNLFSKCVNNLLKDLYKKTKSDNLVFTGGCAMNSVYNGTIKNFSKFKKISISFAPDDSGNSIGAALETSQKNKIKLNRDNFSSFLGTETSDDEILKYLKLYKINFNKPKNLIKSLSQMLSNNLVVGVFRGKSEFGQRALGNRSILASPVDKKIKDKINKIIKFREGFRPFAPVIKSEDLQKIFNTKDVDNVHYMEKVFKFRKKFYPVCPGVIHKDFTGRLQTVNTKTNTFIYNLIDEFEKKTSCPVILNTSLNTNNVPIVNSINDALQVFFNSGLDAIVLGNVIVEKNENLKNKMVNINLFTNSVKFAKIIKRYFHIKAIYYEKYKKDRDLLQFCRKYNIKVIEVKNISKVEKSIFNGSDLGIVYNWGLIFRKDYINKFRHGIWNFHTGDLPKYRGRHPITWAFLKNEKKIGITIHKIDEKIDRGELLTKSFVNRNLDDDIHNIENKIFLKLPKLIIDALKKIESKKLLKIRKGTYYPALHKGVEIKDPKKCDYRYVFNATKAQSTFGGLKIGKMHYKKVFFYNKKNLEVLKNFNIINCKNNKKLILVK